MTETYRTEELEKALEMCRKLRRQMETAKTKKAWREAEEDLNFWQGKAAYLTPPVRLYDATINGKSVKVTVPED